MTEPTATEGPKPAERAETPAERAETPVESREAPPTETEDYQVNDNLEIETERGRVIGLVAMTHESGYVTVWTADPITADSERARGIAGYLTDIRGEELRNISKVLYREPSASEREGTSGDEGRDSEGTDNPAQGATEAEVYSKPAVGDGIAPDTIEVSSGEKEGATAPAGNSSKTSEGKVTDSASEKQGNGGESFDTVDRSGLIVHSSGRAGEQAPAATQVDDAMPMKRVEDKGEVYEEPDYLSTTPERTQRYIYTESGLSGEEGDEHVSYMAKAASQALEKHSRKRPKIKGSMGRYEREKAEWERKGAELQREVDFWESVKGSRAEALAREAAAAREEAARVHASRKAAEQARREEAARKAAEDKKSREAEEEGGEIPEYHHDTPQAARRRGARRFGGKIYKRQGRVTGLFGKEVEIKFSQQDMPRGRVVVMESSSLQPSHIQGERNNYFFIDEGQPKDRGEEVSAAAERTIGSHLRPQEITGSVTAYTGAPTVNARGEVIQGNSRAGALLWLWRNHPENAGKYRQYLIDHAQEFGLNPQEIAQMKQPVLVNMVDVADAEAIRLGQLTAQDTESGGVERLKPKNVAQRLGDRMRSFANILLRTTDEEASLSQLIDRNGVEVMKWMAQNNFISATQYKSAFDSKGNLTAEARNDLLKVLYQYVFKGANPQLEEQFGRIPAKAQRAILSTAFRDMDSPSQGKLLPEIQSAIVAYTEMMAHPEFANAKNMAAALRAVDMFRRQIQMNDRLEPYSPSDYFSNFALHLAAMMKASDVTQKSLTSLFNEMFDLAQGRKAASLMEAADTREYSLAEIVKKVLNIDYEPAKKGNRNDENGSNNVVRSDQAGPGGEPRGAASVGGGELTESGAGSAERRGGTATDSRGSVAAASEESASGGASALAEVSGPEQKRESEERKSEERESEERKSEERKSEERKSEERKSEERKSEEIGLEVSEEVAGAAKAVREARDAYTTFNTDLAWNEIENNEANRAVLARLHSEYHKRLAEYADALLRMSDEELARATSDEKLIDDIEKRSTEYGYEEETRKKFVTARERLHFAISRRRGAEAWQSAPELAEVTGAERPGKFRMIDATCGGRKADERFMGVSHIAGEKVAVATSGMVLVVSKRDYDSSLSGRRVDAKGNDLGAATKLPYKRVLNRESRTTAVKILDPAEAARLSRTLKSIPAKERGEKRVVVALGDGEYMTFNATELDVFLRASHHLGAKEIVFYADGMAQTEGKEGAALIMSLPNEGNADLRMDMSRGVSLHAGEGQPSGDRVAYETTKGLVESTGLEVVEVSDAEASAKLEGNKKTPVSGQPNRANEKLTSGSVLAAHRGDSSSNTTDSRKHAANLEKNTQSAKNKINKFKNGDYEVELSSVHKAMSSLGNLFAMQSHGGSRYTILHSDRGDTVAIRLSDHVANGNNFRRDNADRNLSIVIERRKYDTPQSEIEFTEVIIPESTFKEQGQQVVSAIVKGVESVLADGDFTLDARLGRVEKRGGSVRKLRESGGRVYGWVEGGRVFLNRDAMNPETPVHEYTHLWDAMVKRENPELWKRGVELMKETPLWDEVLNDPNYADIRDDEDAVASEVHSRLTGKAGRERIEQMEREAKETKDYIEKAKKYNIVHTLKSWLKEMFVELKRTLGKWSRRDLEELSEEDFVNLTLRDLAEGMNPNAEMRRGEQARLVVRENPMLDDYHTGIRGREDVLTFDEVLAQSERDYEEYGDVIYPDMTIEMLRDAKESGMITVYSSKPIEAGTFVTPSRMNAQDYAGGKGGKVYEKSVPVEAVAWIDKSEGQYAPVDEGSGLEARYSAAMSRHRAEFEERRERAVAERGIVMPGLNEAEVRVVEVPRHDFEGRGKDALQKAEKWAKENIVGLHQAIDSRGDAFDYSISNEAIDKYLSSSATTKSENIGVHLAALKKLPEIISESIEAEVHADYKKGNNAVRSSEIGFNPDTLIHRFYGAANIDGNIYRIKTTMIESGIGQKNKPHSYEVTTMELSDEPAGHGWHERAGTASTLSRYSGSSSEADTTVHASTLPVAKLLKGVEKSYDAGKKILEESRKSDITIAEEPEAGAQRTLFDRGKPGGNVRFEQLSLFDEDHVKSSGNRSDNERDAAETAAARERELSEREARVDEINGHIDSFTEHAGGLVERYMRYLRVNPDLEEPLMERLSGELEESQHRLMGRLEEFYRNEGNTPEDCRRMARDMSARVMGEVLFRLRPEEQHILSESRRKEIEAKRAENGDSGKELTVTASGEVLTYEHAVPEATQDGNGPVQWPVRKLEPGEFTHVERKFTTTGEFGFTGKEKIESIDDVAFIFRSLEDYSVENAFVVLVKNGRPVIVHLGMGTPTATVVDVSSAKAGIEAYGAEEIYFVHNHPSGNLHASTQDVTILRRLHEVAGERKVEALIIDVTSGRYSTFDKSGTTENHQRNDTGAAGESGHGVQRLNQTERTAEGRDVENLVRISSCNDVAKFVADKRLGNGNKISFLLLSTDNRIIGNLHTLFESYEGNEAPLAEEMVNLGVRYGATSVIPYGNVSFNLKSIDALRDSVESKSGKALRLLDMLNIEGNGERFSSMDQVVREGEVTYPGVPSEIADRSELPLFRESRFDERGAALRDDVYDSEGRLDSAKAQSHAEKALEAIERRRAELMSEGVGAENAGSSSAPEKELAELEYMALYYQRMSAGEDVARTMPTLAEHQRMLATAKEMADSLGEKVVLYEAPGDIEDSDPSRRLRKQRSFGWYNPNDGTIHINIARHKNAQEVARTVLHEVIGHKTIEEVMGRERFSRLIDELWGHCDEDVRRKISEKMSKHGWDYREATKEYLAELAEDVNTRGYEHLEKSARKVWRVLKEKIEDFLNRILSGLRIPKFVRLSETDLSYMMWKFYKHQQRKAAGKPAEGDIFDKAEEIARRAEWKRDERSMEIATGSENTEMRYTSPEPEYRPRQKPAPRNTIKVYKLVRIKDGNINEWYPLFIDSSTPLRMGEWLDADSPELSMLRGREPGQYLVNPQTKEVMSRAEFYVEHPELRSTFRGGDTKYPSVDAINYAADHGLRWIEIEETQKGQRRFNGEHRRYWNLGINGSGSVSTFSMRPGWHAGSLPTMRQIGKGKERNLRDDNFVWVEGEVSADVNYQSEADRNPDKDLPDRIPEDGFYMKATNANQSASQADRVGWYIAGSFKANRVISDAEARRVIDEYNASHPDMPRVEYDYERESGRTFDAESGLHFRDGDDDMGAETIEERLMNMQIALAEAHADDMSLKEAAIESLGDKLSDIRKAMSAQKARPSPATLTFVVSSGYGGQTLLYPHEKCSPRLGPESAIL